MHETDLTDMSEKVRLNKAFINVTKAKYLHKVLNMLKETGVEIYVTSDLYSYCVENSIDAHISTNSEIYQLLEAGSKDINLVVLDIPDLQTDNQISENELFKNIDTKKISLVRLAAKQFKDILVIPSINHIECLSEIIKKQNATSTFADRRKMASETFSITSNYDVSIFNFLNEETNANAFKVSFSGVVPLKYGENPHQDAKFYGDFNEMFDVVSGLELTYNNLLNINTSVDMISEFSAPTCIILKHTNTSGIASRSNLTEAWYSAIENDPISAIRGFITVNRKIDIELAKLIAEIKFVALIAPDYTDEAKKLLKNIPGRMILILKEKHERNFHFRSILNGALVQQKDIAKESIDDYRIVSSTQPTKEQLNDLYFANKIAKHSKTNAIVLVRKMQLLANGNGQNSRVDSLRIALMKANSYGKSLKDAVLASDVPLPFTDIAQIASKEGVKAIIQPGGTQTDNDVTEYCNKNGIAMIHTGLRHVKH